MENPELQSCLYSLGMGGRNGKRGFIWVNQAYQAHIQGSCNPCTICPVQVMCCLGIVYSRQINLGYVQSRRCPIQICPVQDWSNSRICPHCPVQVMSCLGYGQSKMCLVQEMSSIGFGQSAVGYVQSRICPFYCRISTVQDWSNSRICSIWDMSNLGYVESRIGPLYTVESVQFQDMSSLKDVSSIGLFHARH